jgi:molecular chaperone IbpA
MHHRSHSLDISPLFQAGIGFERLLNALDTAPQTAAAGYPPYDILKTGEDSYAICLAVAGCNASALEITEHDGKLKVSGTGGHPIPEDAEIVHKGIAQRSFTRVFQLAEHVRVQDAHLENGLLQIDLVREVPEARRARRIDIRAGTAEQAPANAA